MSRYRPVIQQGTELFPGNRIPCQIIFEGIPPGTVEEHLLYAAYSGEVSRFYNWSRAQADIGIVPTVTYHHKAPGMVLRYERRLGIERIIASIHVDLVKKVLEKKELLERHRRVLAIDILISPKLYERFTEDDQDTTTDPGFGYTVHVVQHTYTDQYDYSCAAGLIADPESDNPIEVKNYADYGTIPPDRSLWTAAFRYGNDPRDDMTEAEAIDLHMEQRKYTEARGVDFGEEPFDHLTRGFGMLDKHNGQPRRVDAYLASSQYTFKNVTRDDVPDERTWTHHDEVEFRIRVRELLDVKLVHIRNVAWPGYRNYQYYRREHIDNDTSAITVMEEYTNDDTFPPVGVGDLETDAEANALDPILQYDTSLGRSQTIFTDLRGQNSFVAEQGYVDEGYEFANDKRNPGMGIVIAESERRTVSVAESPETSGNPPFDGPFTHPSSWWWPVAESMTKVAEITWRPPKPGEHLGSATIKLVV